MVAAAGVWTNRDVRDETDAEEAGRRRTPRRQKAAARQRRKRKRRWKRRLIEETPRSSRVPSERLSVSAPWPIAVYSESC